MPHFDLYKDRVGKHLIAALDVVFTGS